MKAGLFLMSSHPPERPLYDAHQFDLDVIALADELGYQEAWIGEHFTAPWEPIPSPDLMIAQALTRTKNIKLGAGAHLLPYHHPAELALRIAYLDHLSQGRLLVGIGAGGLQTDAIMFDVDFDAGENREMTRESPGDHAHALGRRRRAQGAPDQALEGGGARSEGVGVGRA